MTDIYGEKVCLSASATLSSREVRLSDAHVMATVLHTTRQSEGCRRCAASGMRRRGARRRRAAHLELLKARLQVQLERLGVGQVRAVALVAVPAAQPAPVKR